ncbi:hypothetical protein BDN72DRAFT_837928 [Pluteus cervinus]|uniref:Uncharacterized protein n=1 Tax=Pluteus cervinus TaxID=181527 RepID=A0ACD3AZK9_9AGAR|nr:hypothetical protein BDN72DRAFT_837928 [Pluteus cervinus]
MLSATTAPTGHDLLADMPRHADLLEAISDLEYVPATLKRQDSYVKELEEQVTEALGKVEVLTEKTKKERAEHLRIRDATASKWAHTLTGRGKKYEEKATKEEREYHHALEKEMEAKDTLGTYQQLLEDAKRAHEKLIEKAERLKALKEELESLYERIFDGPSPDFPEEDEMERELRAAQNFHDQIQAQISVDSQAAEILKKADQTLGQCVSNIEQAVNQTRWGGNDTRTQTALSEGVSLTSKVQTLIGQAQHVSPLVQSIEVTRIPYGLARDSMYWDDSPEDTLSQGRLRGLVRDLSGSKMRLKAEHDAAFARAQSLDSELERATKRLQTARSVIHEYRRVLFESLSASWKASVVESPLNPGPPSHWKSNNPFAAVVARTASASGQGQ